jgi:hypothetical protein
MDTETVNETQAGVAELSPRSDTKVEIDPADELIAAQAERIRLLEAEAAAREAQPDMSFGLDEAFVKPGEGFCLECSCIKYAVPFPGERPGSAPGTCGPAATP